MNRVALITGGAKRVGRQICKTLSEQGFVIAIHYNNSIEEAFKLQQELGNARVFQANFEDLDSVGTLIDRVVDNLGRIDLLVNNASLFYKTPAGRTSIPDLQRIGTVNLTAPLLLSMRAMEMMKDNREGRIVNIGDIMMDVPPPGYSAYTATRAAIMGMTKALSVEGASLGIAVNMVALGTIMMSQADLAIQKQLLERVPTHSIPGPQTAAHAVAFFANAPLFITGAVLHVDGGRHLT